MKAIQTTEKMSQNGIEQLLAMKESKANLKKRLELISSSIADLESDLIAKVERGEVIDGKFTLKVKRTEKRFPAWKEHFISLAGKEEADAILDSTIPKVYKALNIKAA